jgi:zeaxanthin epoxidase
MVWEEGKTLPRIENFNYAGIVTRMLQPILPIFFIVQFAFLYDGYRNENQIDLGAALGFTIIGGLMLLLSAGVVGEAGIAASIGFEAFIGAEGILDFETISNAAREFLTL